MNLYENFSRRIQYIDDNMTLKSDYTEELEALDGIKSDISVGLYLNSFSPQMAANLLKRIENTKNWILEEQTAG